MASHPLPPPWLQYLDWLDFTGPFRFNFKFRTGQSRAKGFSWDAIPPYTQLNDSTAEKSRSQGCNLHEISSFYSMFWSTKRQHIKDTSHQLSPASWVGDLWLAWSVGRSMSCKSTENSHPFIHTFSFTGVQHVDPFCSSDRTRRHFRASFQPLGYKKWGSTEPRSPPTAACNVPPVNCPPCHVV